MKSSIMRSNNNKTTKGGKIITTRTNTQIAATGGGGNNKATMLSTLTDLNRVTESNQLKLQNLELAVATLTTICNGLHDDVRALITSSYITNRHGKSSSDGEAAAEAIDIKSCKYSSSSSPTSSSGSINNQQQRKRRVGKVIVSGSKGVRNDAAHTANHPGNKRMVSKATATKTKSTATSTVQLTVPKVLKLSTSKSSTAAVIKQHKNYTAGSQQVQKQEESKKPSVATLVKKYNMEPTNNKDAVTKSSVAVNKNMGTTKQKSPTKSTIFKEKVTPMTAKHPAVSTHTEAKNVKSLVRAGKTATKTVIHLKTAGTRTNGSNKWMKKTTLSKSPVAKSKGQVLPVSGQKGAGKKISGGLITVSIPPEHAVAPSTRKYWFGTAANSSSGVGRDAQMTNAYCSIGKAIKKR